MKTLALASVKGGVGKTTGAVTFAHLAALEGARVLLWDLDPQGAATHVLRIGRRPPGGARRLLDKRGTITKAIVPSTIDGIDVVPADFSLRHLDLELDRMGRPRRRIRRALRVVRDRYDVVILDCPPGIGLAVDAALRATDVLLVPIVPAELPMRGYEMLAAYVAAEKRLKGTEVLGFLSMVDGHKPAHRQNADDLAVGVTAVLEPPVPLSVAAERMVELRRPLTASEPDSPAAIAYRAVWADLTSRVRFDHLAGDAAAAVADWGPPAISDRRSSETSALTSPR